MRDFVRDIRDLGKSPEGILALLVLSTLILHVVVAATTPYGLHRDEYLYLALGRHLDWGFLEVPPGIAAVAAVLQSTTEASLEAVRFVPGLGHAVLVLLTGLLVREFKGGGVAVLTAGLASLIAPVYLRAGTLFQPVVFDQLAWTGAALFVARRIRTGDPRYWLGVGAVCGLGLLFKYSVLVFGAGLAVGLLATPLRRDLWTPWPWAGAMIAGAVAVPNLVWQSMHNWPLLQHLQALSESQLVHVAPLDFVVEQVLMMHPITVPIWSAGLMFFFARRGGAFQSLGWIYLACFGLLLALQGKPYYLAPAYPMLFAAGGCLLTEVMERWRPTVLRPTLLTGLLVGGMALAPMGVPVLSPPTMAQYLETLGVHPESETGTEMSIPQDYADMLGWRRMVVRTAQVYYDLPPAERERVVLFGESYGHAGAIDYYGPTFGLPGAISASSSYYLWGPGDRAGSVTIFLGLDEGEVRPYFERCTTDTIVRHRWARENAEPIVVCRNPARDLSALWPSFDPW